MQSSINLPPPDPIARTHSDQLKQHILAEIRAQGPISFAHYMELALYAPGLGYYTAGSRKFGAAGDFITAPEISPLFSQCVARSCEAVLQHLPRGDILEFGAGSGAMAAQLLLTLEASGNLPHRYFILEISADLTQRQQQLLQSTIPHLYPRVQWLDRLSEQAIEGVIIANEVLDALPVHLFRVEKEKIHEFYIHQQQNKLHLCLQTATPDVADAVYKLDISSKTYQSEINLLLPKWINTLAACLKRGMILLLDYGFLQFEYYHPERAGGTLMCHYRHHAHDNPLLYPGLQDITAHVNFTAVSDAAQAADLTLSGYTNQANFLLNCGILDLLATITDNRERMQANQAVKKLLFPTEMGELFKVMALTRQWDLPLIGF